MKDKTHNMNSIIKNHKIEDHVMGLEPWLWNRSSKEWIPWFSTGRRGNNLVSNWKLLKCLKKCRKHSIFVMLSPKLILKFIKVNDSLMLYDGRDKCNFQWGEYLRASGSTRVFAWVHYSSISWIQRKCFVNKWLLDTEYVTDLLDPMVIVMQEGDVGFDIGRYNVAAPRHGWLWQAKSTTLIQL